MEVSGIVGGTESVRGFDERRLLFADLTTVGAIDGGAIGGERGFTAVGVCEGDLTIAGVSEGVFLRAGGIEGSAKLDPRDMVSVLVVDGVFDVRPLLLRWDAGLLSGEGGFNWV